MNEYYLGLDIGTDSIGWAVTNTDYTIPKFKGNAMWGIRLLEESNTALERRGFRSARRRTSRKRFRLDCLQMLFDREIAKKDIAFFQRLEESNLYLEDKSTQCKYCVFNDEDYTDKDYHKQYPTIYHLRKELVESKEVHDVRLVYLAVSHLVKNRGHFLFDSENLGGDGLPDFNDIWNELCDCISDFYEDIDLSLDNTDELQKILKSRITKTEKKKQLTALYSIKSEPCASIFTLLAGGTVQLAKMFNDEQLKDSEVKSMTFSSGFDDKASDYEAVLEDRFELIEKLKAVYDWGVLADILKGEKYISFAKTKIYDKHKADLKMLKEFVKEYCNDEYYTIFKENKKGVNNYPAYCGHSSKGEVNARCVQADFCDFLKKKLPKEAVSEQYAQMFNDIEAGVFMPKAVSTDNSVIPMQLNKAELKRILNNAGEYLEFLNDTDESGKSVADKIMDIFSFRIPYYVGPLNRHSDKAWVVRSDEKIYPWNFEQVVDMDKSAQAFIDNLTSKCTYLKKEDVLPKSSLLYTRFMVLNELNNLKVNGEKITVELKQKIYNDLFLHKSRVTQKALKNYLKSYYCEDFEISGIDGDFKANLKPHMDFADFNLTQNEKDEIVKAITIFGDDKKLLKSRLVKMFSSKLTADEIKKISKLKYTGWGRLSEKFLTGIYSAIDETGEAKNIIDALWETNNNLMQLLSDDFTYIREVENQNENMFTSLKQEVDSLYVSPKVKRPIYQSMLIVEELVKIQKHAPEKIFIEVARGEEAKKRTVSRKNKLLELYKSCKNDYPQLYNEIEKRSENDFRRDAVYLYFTQFGRCMYSNTRLSLDDLSNCDIDHIFPQSKIKDDSLDNRVLVLKTENEDKKNVYPIKKDIRDKMSPFWKVLLDKDLISKKKYERLTRNYALTDDELNSFISRQLVETRQSTKAVAELLKKRYPDTKIVYVKANIAADFRKKYEKYNMLKCREVNDYHHAKDAYLNIVTGNVYDVKFTSKYFISELQSGACSLNKMFDYNVKGAWIADGGKSLQCVKAVMAKNNIRYTRHSFKQKGGLFKQQILKKGNGQVPIKMNSPVSDIQKYGGYDKAKSTYFVFCEYVTEKGKHIRSFEPIDLYEEKLYISNPIQFLKERIKDAVDVKILIPCVKYNALISVDGFRMHISSKSNGGASIVCKPAVQLVLGGKLEMYAKKISNYFAKCRELGKVKEITKWDHITFEENVELYNAIKDKLTNTVFNVKFSKLALSLAENCETFKSLSLYEQCYVILELLKILHANVVIGDLQLIGGSKKSGTLTISNKIQPNVKEFSLINQSITGLFETKVNLLK